MCRVYLSLYVLALKLYCGTYEKVVRQKVDYNSHEEEISFFVNITTSPTPNCSETSEFNKTTATPFGVYGETAVEVRVIR